MLTVYKSVFLIGAALAFCAFIYGAYWVAKTGSYWFFYESMVQDTIQEQVKTDCLRGAL